MGGRGGVERGVAVAAIAFLIAGPSCTAPQGPVTERTVSELSAANTLTPSADTSVMALTPNQNYGRAKILIVNEALIQFDQAALATLVPPGGVVSSAHLQVTLDAALTIPVKNGSTLGVFRMTHPWTEAGATFNCAVDSNTANLKADCSESTAWKLSSTNGLPWTSIATATSPVTTGETGTLTFDVTADVRGFVTRAFPDDGWIIRSEAFGRTFVAFGSRESTKPPILTVTVGCAPGFADCDHNPANGCEQALTALTNCRSCGISCDDGNPCTADACDAVAGCVHKPVGDGAPCDDSNRCTQTDTCKAGACRGTNPVVCAATDQCHTAGVCESASGACSNPAAPDGTACNDGTACTQTDSCQLGTCTGTNPVICAAQDQCHTAGTCNSSTGICSNPTAVDGNACNDGNACTTADTCQSGICIGTAAVCTAQDQCHLAGTCDPSSGTCSNPMAADGTACNDGNACTRTDSCLTGICTGSSPVTCAASDPCHSVGVCDPHSGTCSNPSLSDVTCASASIGPQGGSVQVPGVGRVDIPPGALSAPTNVFMEKIPTPTIPNSGVAFTTSAVTLGPDGLSFQQPATLTLTYNPQLLFAPTAAQNQHIYRILNNSLVPTGTTTHETVDVPDASLSVPIGHFSSYVGGLASGSCLETVGQGENPNSIAVDSTNIYWTNRGIEGESDGSVVTTSISGGIPITLASAQDLPEGVAVDATNVYWIANRNLMTVPLSGGMPAAIIEGVGAFAVDTTGIYWTNIQTGTVLKMPLGGGTAPTTLASDQNSPGSIAVNGTSVFWTSGGTQTTDGTVWKIPLAGGTPIALASQQSFGGSIVANSTHVYWISELPGPFNVDGFGDVNTVSVAGGTPTPVAENSFLSGLALDASNIYVAAFGDDSNGDVGSVFSEPLGGGVANILTAGTAAGGVASGPDGIAVDANSVYWTNVENGTVMKATPKTATICGGACVNEQTDPNNCGGCGVKCITTDPNAIGADCSGGSCVTTCNAGFSICNGVCTNVQIDPGNCGGCGVQCATDDPNATAPRCNNGVCGATCKLGFSLANGLCITLVSVTISPSSPVLSSGASEHFQALGTYSDSSVVDLTNVLTWTSSAPNVVSISNDPASAGLSIAGIAGTAAISATDPTTGVFGSATATVEAAGPCGTLPNGSACDDGDACTTADSCFAGSCNGIPLTTDATGASCVPKFAAVVGASDGSGRTFFVGGGTDDVDYSSIWTGTSFGANGPLTSLIQPRIFPAVVANADTLFVFGGRNGSTALASVELVRGAVGPPVLAAPMLSPRSEFTATFDRGSGDIITLGGYDGTSVVTNAERYNPSLDTWTSLAPLPTARALHAAARTLTGQILLIGGIDQAGPTAEVDLYDPPSNTWTKTASLPAARFGGSAVTDSTGTVYVAGGVEAGSSTLARGILSWNSSSAAWTVTSNVLAKPRYRPTAILEDDQHIYLVGGTNVESATDVEVITIASPAVASPAVASVSDQPATGAPASIQHSAKTAALTTATNICTPVDFASCAFLAAGLGEIGPIGLVGLLYLPTPCKDPCGKNEFCLASGNNGGGECCPTGNSLCGTSCYDATQCLECDSVNGVPTVQGKNCHSGCLACVNSLVPNVQPELLDLLNLPHDCEPTCGGTDVCVTCGENSCGIPFSQCFTDDTDVICCLSGEICNGIAVQVIATSSEKKCPGAP